ncbi:MAG: DUF2793 domain-containing protein [Sphingomonas sp.]
MTDETSARLALPLLAAGQAQKEMTVNEALTRLDVAVQASAVAGGVDAPPASPSIGQCWIIGNAPADAWSGHAGQLAAWTSGGWRFVLPVEGLAVWVEADAIMWRYRGGAWAVGEIVGNRVLIGGIQTLGAQQAAIADPAGGSITDQEARDAIAAILSAMRIHGLIAA